MNWELAHLPARLPGDFFGMEKIDFADRAIEPDRIDLRDRGEERRVAFADEAADRNLLRADAPRDRRLHITIPEIQFRRSHPRFSGSHIRLVRFLRGHGGVEILLGSGPLRHERREPGDFQRAPGQRGPGVRQHSFRGGELLFVGLLVEFKKRSARLHLSSLFKQNLLHKRLHPRPHLDILRRVELADEGGGTRDVLLRHLHDLHDWRRSLRRRGLLATRCAQRYRCREEQPGGPSAGVSPHGSDSLSAFHIFLYGWILVRVPSPGEKSFI